MNYFDTFAFEKIRNPVLYKGLISVIIMLVFAASLTACSSKEKKAGQSLARVDGEEITMFQLNEELQRANIQPGQQEEANKQLLESLIDQQLIIAEAVRNKIDRTPEVVQAIARAKTQVITKAYFQGIAAKVAKPTKIEIDEYYQKNPEFFANRKQLAMTNVIISSKDFNDELKSVMTSAKTMSSVIEWMNEKKLPYKRGQLTRTTADLPPEMSDKLLKLQKGSLFIVNEGINTMLITLDSVKDSPVTAKDAASMIEQYLTKQKIKEIADTEVKHLRSLAKVEYLNASAPTASKDKVAPPEPTIPSAK